MIDEKKLIEELHTWDMQDLYLPVHFENLVEAQPKVGEWIPIGQYPSEPSLLCFEDGSMAVGYVDEWEDVRICDYDCYHISDGMPIAYMPLPQPYKGE